MLSTKKCHNQVLKKFYFFFVWLLRCYNQVSIITSILKSSSFPFRTNKYANKRKVKLHVTYLFLLSLLLPFTRAIVREHVRSCARSGTKRNISAINSLKLLKSINTIPKTLPLKSVRNALNQSTASPEFNALLCTHRKNLVRQYRRSFVDPQVKLGTKRRRMKRNYTSSDTTSNQLRVKANKGQNVLIDR